VQTDDGTPRLSARRRPPFDVVLVVGAYAVAVALFAPFAVVGDGTFYYDFTRRLVGDGGVVYAYQWGASLWNAPFYVVGHLLGLPHETPVGHATGEPFRDASIAFAGGLAAIGAVLVSRAVVRRLGLPSNALLLLGVLFGTELWFYGVFEPSYTHAVDALAFSVAGYLVVRIWQGSPPLVAGLLGACLACLVSIRYANVAALPGLLLPVVLRRERAVVVNVVIGAAGAAALLVAIPLLLGAGFGDTADFTRGHGAPGSGARGSSAGPGPAAALLIPLRMLFSPERGLFAYAPLCLVGLAGFVLAALRPSANRIPVVGIGVAGLGILWIYAAFGENWRGGGYSYGQRFLTSLTVVTLIGLAELTRRAPRVTAVAVVLCTAWSLFVGLNFAYGWAGVSNQRRNVDDIVRLYASGDRTLPEFARLLAYRVHERFTG